MELWAKLTEWPMITWLLYNTVIPLSPVLLVYTAFWLVGPKKKVRTIIRDAQLCFYCTSLAAVVINNVASIPNIH